MEHAFCLLLTLSLFSHARSIRSIRCVSRTIRFVRSFVSVIDLEEGRKESINANKKLNSWRPHGYGSVPCIDLPTIKLALLFSVSQPGRSPALPVSSLSPAPTPTLPMQRPGGHGLTCSRQSRHLSSRSRLGHPPRCLPGQSRSNR
jgi:hypothetical protein